MNTTMGKRRKNKAMMACSQEDVIPLIILMWQGLALLSNRLFDEVIQMVCAISKHGTVGAIPDS